MWDVFKASYISRKKAESKVDNFPENKLFTPTEYSPVMRKFEPIIEDNGKTYQIDATTCRKMALTCSLYMKGVQKKSRDTFRAGFKITKEGKEISSKEVGWINDFNARNDILAKLDLTKWCNHIYGTGIWYLEFRGELVRKLNDSKYEINDSVSPGNDLPFRMTVIDPEQVKEWKYKNSYWKTKGIQHLLIRKDSGEEYYIHPDRIIDLAERKLPFSKFGISDMVILRHIMCSFPDIDIGTGKTLKWFSHGILHWTKAGATPNDIDIMKKYLLTKPDAFYGDEKYKLEVFNPEAINPQPFYDWITLCIAATLVMPTHVLKGVEIGRVTGAEAGYSDYHHDIADSQRLVYNPALKKLYQKIYDYYSTETQKYVFDADIEWNPTYVSEMAEAELDSKRAEGVIGLLASGVITIDEARQRLNQGHTQLSEKVLTELARKASLTDDKYKEEKDKQDKYDAMIKLRNDILSGKDLDAGKIEEISQELRLKEAEKCKKN